MDALPPSGAVFAFGHADLVLSNFFWIRDDTILSVSCGASHSALLTKSGRIFVFGQNDHNQLGLRKSLTLKSKPTSVKALKTFKIVQVALGQRHTFVLTDEGLLLGFGANDQGQLGLDEDSNNENTNNVYNEPQVISGNKVFIYLAVGDNHSLALDNYNRAYVWGSNVDGQLGLGQEAEEIVRMPTLIEDLDQIKTASCGSRHTALVTFKGEMFTCGDGDSGQLGLDSLGDEGRAEIPTKVDLNDYITSVSCGSEHTLALSKSGVVYAFGQGSHGQLGLGTSVLQSNFPQKIATLAKRTIVKIACGQRHSAMVDHRGKLYTCGDAADGKLCDSSPSSPSSSSLAESSNSFVPQFVNYFQGLQVLSVACGQRQTLVLAKPIAVNMDFSIDPGLVNRETNELARIMHRQEQHEQQEEEKEEEKLDEGSNIKHVVKNQTEETIKDNDEESDKDSVTSSETLDLQQEGSSSNEDLKEEEVLEEHKEDNNKNVTKTNVGRKRVTFDNNDQNDEYLDPKEDLKNSESNEQGAQRKTQNEDNDEGESDNNKTEQDIDATNNEETNNSNEAPANAWGKAKRKRIIKSKLCTIL